MVLQGAYLHGLSDYIKDELEARNETSSLDELIALSITLDNRLQERHWIKRSQKSHLPPQPWFRQQFNSPAESTPPSSVLPASDESMQIRPACLTPTEM